MQLLFARLRDAHAAATARAAELPPALGAFLEAVLMYPDTAAHRALLAAIAAEEAAAAAADVADALREMSDGEPVDDVVRAERLDAAARFAAAAPALCDRELRLLLWLAERLLERQRERGALSEDGAVATLALLEAALCAAPLAPSAPRTGDA